MIQEKIESAKDLIIKVLDSYKNPAILCSFGKDSILLTHLALSVNSEIPIIFFRQSYHHLKQYTYADKMIQWFGDKFDATIIQGLPPKYVELINNGNAVDFIQHYEMGAKNLMLPAGVIPDEGGICSKDKILHQMRGQYSWPYDVLFCGHKHGDENALFDGGKIPISLDILQVYGSSSMAYPLRMFSHQEVFEGIKNLGIPMDYDRYEFVNGEWHEKDNKTFNGDWTRACINCVNPNGQKTVMCPKNGLLINNIGKEIVAKNQLNDLEYCKV